MAELGTRTVEELVSKVLADEHVDALREAVAYLPDALMEAEVGKPLLTHSCQARNERARR